jgi:xylan 1,4-beta-xylosidase
MAWPAPSSPYGIQRTQTSQKRKIILSILPLILVLLISLISITQLDQIREFFGRASGEPANIVIDTQAVLGPMPRPWRNLAQGGEQFNWRMEPILPQVKALKPRYIRLDHIYDFYEIVQGTPGNLTFNFTKFDAILDDIKASGAKPYIALSYMPPAISSGDILAKPVNWTDWQLVVQKTIEHVSGTRKTADVYYEVWNEPDLFGNWKYFGDKNYLTLYDYAARGAMNARGVQPFKIGGPAITALYKNWFDALAKYALANRLRLDFFSWHRYSKDLNQYKKDMFEVESWVQAYPQLEPTLEFHITEWGHDSNNHAGYDTNYGAAHTVAGSIEMINIIDNAFVFEIQDGKDPAGQTYWGRWGLFTTQDSGSKPKPRYNALRMLDRISSQRLQLLGKGTWVKAVAARSDEGNTQIVIANYDPSGGHSENVPITFQNIEPGNYSVRTEFLGGRQQTEKVATTAAALRIQVPMGVNSVGFIELKKE